MSIPRVGRHAAGLKTAPGSVHEKRYSAAILGDGQVLPIIETLGRRMLREIDPMSSEGRSLLDEGKVTLWYDDGARVETAPIQQVLDRLRSTIRARRDVYAKVPRWTAHHD